VSLQSKRYAIIALVLLGIIAPFVIHPLIAMKILCFALFAAAFNLMAGYLGLISFGHAAFFGMAAYVAGYSVKVWQLPTEVGILLATAFTALLGLAMGSLAVRRKGVYFAMITLALSQLVYFYAHQSPWTGGEDGMAGVPRGKLFGIIDLTNNLTMYAFVFVIAIIGFTIIWRAVNSPFGSLMLAIRDNEQRVISLGYNVYNIKLMAFVLSATLSGLAGATKAIVFQFASETDVIWGTSGIPVLAALIGGIGTLIGPAIGGAIMVALETVLAGFGEWVYFVQGVIFVIVVLFFRRGIFGEIQARWLDKPIQPLGHDHSDTAPHLPHPGQE